MDNVVLLAVLLALAGLAVLAILVVLGISAWVAHNYTLVRRMSVRGHPSQYGLAYEEVEFPSRGDKLRLKGWYLPVEADDRCIILVQGEDHHRNSPGIKALELGRDLVACGFSVLLFDVRGRGESGGKRGSGGDREQWDTLGAIDYVRLRSIPVERMGLIGFSMGAAVAILVAAKEKRIPAVVADSAFLDYIPHLKRVPFYFMFLPGWFAYTITLAGSMFFGADFGNVRPIKALRRVAPRPVFFIHGDSDHVIAYQETLELYEASGNKDNSLWIVPGAGHVRSYSRAPQEYVARVAEFFQRYIK